MSDRNYLAAVKAQYLILMARNHEMVKLIKAQRKLLKVQILPTREHSNSMQELIKKAIEEDTRLETLRDKGVEHHDVIVKTFLTITNISLRRAILKENTP